MGIETALFFFVFWFFMGLVWGILSSQLKRLFTISKIYLLAASVVSAVILLFIFTRMLWHLDSNFGWGFYAVPPCIVGVVTANNFSKGFKLGFVGLMVWEFAVGIIALNVYFSEMDVQSYGISYWHAQMQYDKSAVNKVLDGFNAQIDATIGYLIITLLLQIVPFILFPKIGRIKTLVRKPVQAS